MACRSVNGYRPWLEDIFNVCIDDHYSRPSLTNREVQFSETVQFPQKSDRRTKWVPWTFIVDQMNLPEVFYWTFGIQPPEDMDLEAGMSLLCPMSLLLTPSSQQLSIPHRSMGLRTWCLQGRRAHCSGNALHPAHRSRREYRHLAFVPSPLQRCRIRHPSHGRRRPSLALSTSLRSPQRLAKHHPRSRTPPGRSRTQQPRPQHPRQAANA